MGCFLWHFCFFTIYLEMRSCYDVQIELKLPTPTSVSQVAWMEKHWFWFDFVFNDVIFSSSLFTSLDFLFQQMVIENAREKILSNKSLQEKLAENINKFLTRWAIWFKTLIIFAQSPNCTNGFPFCVVVITVLLKYLSKQTTTLPSQKLQLMNS